MVDGHDELTDVRMPESGTHGHVTLLAEHLAAAEGPVPEAELERRVRELAAERGSFWSKTAREPGAEPELVRQALAKLTTLSLVTRTGEGVVARPALARFAVGETVVLDTRAPGTSPGSGAGPATRPPSGRTSPRDLSPVAPPLLAVGAFRRHLPAVPGAHALAATAHRIDRLVLLRRGRVPVPRRTASAARQQRHRQIQGAGPDRPFLLDGDLSARRIEPDGARVSAWSGTCCSAVPIRTPNGWGTPGSSSAAATRAGRSTSAPCCAASRQWPGVASRATGSRSPTSGSAPT